MIKKILIYIAIILLMIIIIVFVKLIFIGKYENYNANKISYGFLVNNNTLKVEVYNFDEWITPLKVKYKLIDKNIYIYTYSISTLIEKKGQNKLYIKLPKKNIYRIYYLNKNDEKIHLKDIEYK